MDGPEAGGLGVWGAHSEITNQCSPFGFSSWPSQFTH